MSDRKTLTVFGHEYPVMAELEEGFFLIAVTNGPAISHMEFHLLSSPAHSHEDVPEKVRRAAVMALMRWAAAQPTWPKL